ncbi:DgyrCDS4868 [Dimorphilus gyrociliatus]|uniref:DgyrCDS4868 n=1 Tax=Dimorphilus gyrociliatus TaxID=2664684 RepID=A0A7I8VJQ5_9ANNE|nr:DgyrCDS4868 [Dimorphilus gyrociliatus]
MADYSSKKFQPNAGDWICGDKKCGNVNFSKREKCNRCGRSRMDGEVYQKGGMEIGKNIAEKSKGLFSADDWQCKTCGNINWARRNACNICNAPKHGKVEKRTGYGGGFMERDEVVEYKEYKDEDNEYDEFGRKKKEYRVSAVTKKDSGESGRADGDEDDDSGILEDHPIFHHRLRRHIGVDQDRGREIVKEVDEGDTHQADLDQDPDHVQGTDTEGGDRLQIGIQEGEGVDLMTGEEDQGDNITFVVVRYLKRISFF